MQFLIGAGEKAKSGVSSGVYSECARQWTECIRKYGFLAREVPVNSEFLLNLSTEIL
jgi:hypothetical protein